MRQDATKGTDVGEQIVSRTRDSRQPVGLRWAYLTVPMAALATEPIACSASESEPKEHVASVRQAEGSYDDCDDTGPSDTLEEYAAKCDEAIGASVPDFDCDEGSEVDEGTIIGAYPDQVCDRPNVLNHGCDPHSRFQVLHASPANPDVLMVAHCRKKGNQDQQYGDVAVIQYNKKNGATCFYQSPIESMLPAKVSAPKLGNSDPGRFPWKSPASVAAVKCVSCHDNGPFIRSPYLSHLIDDSWAFVLGNVLPGSHDSGWNKTLPYKFVGNDFQSWKVYSVSAPVGSCGSCHRMGMSSAQGTFEPIDGTSINFGLIATQEFQQHKYPGAPMWMKPGQLAYDADVESEAESFAKCAYSIASHRNDPQGTLPPAVNCNSVEYGQGVTCHGAPVRLVLNGATQSTPGDSRVDVTVSLGSCSSGACPTGFAYWRTIHGPFWQDSDSSIPPGDADYRGAFLRLNVNPNGGIWEASYFVDPTDLSSAKAAPGGVVEWTPFSDIHTIADPTTCGSGYYSIVDPDGTRYSDSVAIGDANRYIEVLTGFIGNIAQSNTGDGDFLRLYTSSANAVLAQQHVELSQGPLVNGPLKGEAWRSGCSSWTPEYAVQNLHVTSDAELVSYPQSKNVRCFITGLTGAWSSTRDSGSIQPYAEIYIGTAKETRLRVFPGDNGSPADRVGAYASCIKLN